MDLKMFRKGLSKQDLAAQRADSAQPRFQYPNLYPIMKAEKLLSGRPRQQLLKELSTHLSGVSNERQKALYYSTINRFAELVQHLPGEREGAFAYYGGRFDLGLEIAIVALSLRRDEHQNHLWTYAIFTAALLQTVGDLLSEFWISLCNKEGEYQAPWNPMSGSMTQIKLPEISHYRYSYKDLSMRGLSEYAVLMLAPRILSPEGLHWLASNHVIFSYWLATLVGDEGGGGTLGPLVGIARVRVTSKQMEAAAFDINGLLPASYYVKKDSDSQTNAAGEKGVAAAQDTDESRAGKERKEKAETGEKEKKSQEKSAESTQDSQREDGGKRADRKGNFSSTAGGKRFDVGKVDIAGSFISWIQKNISVLGKEGKAVVTNEGVLVTDKAIKDFVQQTKGTDIKGVEKALAAKGIIAKGSNGQTAFRYSVNQGGKQVGMMGRLVDATLVKATSHGGKGGMPLNPNALITNVDAFKLPAILAYQFYMQEQMETGASNSGPGVFSTK